MKLNKYLIFAAMGVELVGLMVGSLLLGQYLDARLGTKGLMMMGLSIVSLGGWLYHIIYLAKSIEKNSDKPE